jgi:shikimate kinase
VRSVVLVTGMSGTGKSAALRELAARGHRAVDLDYGYSVLVPDPAVPVGWEQRWDEEKVTGLLDGHRDGTLFLAGTVSNQRKFYDRFDAVVLLTAPADVLLPRIAERSDNPFGKDERGRATVLHHLETVEPLLRRGATHVLDAARPLADVVDDLERIVG